jgi:Retinitis pigmentosa G-protein regulator interacting C-terminal
MKKSPQEKKQLQRLCFKLPSFLSPQKKSENSLHKLHNDGNDSTTIAEFSKRKNSQTQDANTLPRCLLENTKDEKLLMRFVSMVAWWKIPRLILMTQFHISQGSNVIEIEVNSLEAVSCFKKDKLLFVEYSFLDFKGHLLETQSLPAPSKPNDLTIYRHVQKFVLDTSKHAKQIKILSSMLSTNNSNSEPIKFYVVSESVDDDTNEDDELNHKECEEVG